jgi:hypothetical protein|tara:strand:+ start:765 stop:1622 length:858 start_codon:yes stop_codon:yes gene_type:complete
MDSTFNVSKYDAADNSLVSLSDSYANHIKTYISFKHLDSAQTVYFKAFITNLVDTFSADWTRESIYGRVDPVPIYAQTQRSISLNLTIPADSIGEAYENLARVQKLVQFLYPSYTTGDDGSRTITKSPLIRLKAMNLVSKGESIDKEIQRALRMADSALAFSRAETDPDPMPRPDYYKNYTSDASPDNGLLGFINGLTVMHNLENEGGVFEKAQNTVLAKQIDISLTFMPVHEENPSAAGGIFPYNVELQSDVKVDGWYGTSLSGSTAAEANDQAATQGVLNNVK